MWDKCFSAVGVLGKITLPSPRGQCQFLPKYIWEIAVRMGVMLFPVDKHSWETFEDRHRQGPSHPIMCLHRNSHHSNPDIIPRGQAHASLTWCVFLPCSAGNPILFSFCCPSFWSMMSDVGYSDLSVSVQSAVLLHYFCLLSSHHSHLSANYYPEKLTFLMSHVIVCSMKFQWMNTIFSFISSFYKRKTFHRLRIEKWQHNLSCHEHFWKV